MSSEFIPLPRNMEFDIINTSYPGLSTKVNFQGISLHKYNIYLKA